LNDDATRRRILHHLSNVNSETASFDMAVPASLGRVAGFEDLYWLFTPNAADHGLSRLEIDEAALVFAVVREMGAPRAIEIGRFRGGSTFLLAAAGARVLSIDIDEDRSMRDTPPLERALERFGLADRVEVVVGDSRTYPAERDSFDLAFLDGDHTYEGVRADVEHWLPALRKGGELLLHDAEFPETDSRRPITVGVARLAAELDRDPRVEGRQATGSFARFVRIS
jgi:predicted O-methyltransferase YrrM